MSDDFAICKVCGEFDGETINPEQELERIDFEIKDLKQLQNKPQTETDKKYIISQLQDLEEEKKDMEQHLNNQEVYCKKCDHWTTFLWQHINYKE